MKSCPKTGGPPSKAKYEQMTDSAQYREGKVKSKAVLDLEFEVHQATPLRVSISIGAFLVTPEFKDNMMKAVNFADQALYKAKEGGRNQVIQYTETV